MAVRRSVAVSGAVRLKQLVERALPTANWFLGRHVRVALLAIMLMVLGSGLVVPAHAAPSSGRILPQLAQDGASNPDTSFRVLISRRGKNAKADEKVRAAGGAKVRDLPGVESVFVANVPGNKLAQLSTDADVDYISYDAEMVNASTVESSKLATLYPEVVKATTQWAAASALTGAGIGVAVLDTGIQSSLPDWRDASGVSRIKTQILFNSNTKSMNDGHGHGTHVAGIIAGNSWRNGTSTVQGKYIGIAPEANLINVKVSDDTGKSYVSDVVSAIDWVVQNRQTYNIRVMNLSLVAGTPESARTSVLAAAVERAWFNGIFVVAAAGNSGANSMLYAPANDPYVMTVGAADPMTTIALADDTVAPWSSYGMTQDGYNKPDVVAPGRHMVSTLASGGSTLAKSFPDRIVDNTYLRMSGTSMAAPVVSGMAALLFQAHPEWTNDQVKWLLMHTATQLSETAPASSTLLANTDLSRSQGAGEPDIASVLSYSGTPGYANQGLVPSLWLITPDGDLLYDSANWSTANWSTANWSTANWSTANWSTANWSTANWSTANRSAANWSSSSWRE